MQPQPIRETETQHQFRIKLTMHQAMAIRQASQRMQSIQAILNAYADADRQYTDTLIRDAGYQPEEFEPAAQMQVEGDNQFLVLTVKQA